MAGGLSMNKDIQLYCNFDGEGNIIEIYTGQNIIPTRTYDHFEMIDKQTEVNLDKFHVVDGKLLQIEGTTLIQVGNIKLTTEQELEEVKKKLAEMQELLAKYPIPSELSTESYNSTE